MIKKQRFKTIEYTVAERKMYGIPWAAKLVLEGEKIRFLYLQRAYKDRRDGGTLWIELENGCAYAYGEKDLRGDQDIITYFGIDKDGKEIEFENLDEVREFLRS